MEPLLVGLASSCLNTAGWTGKTLNKGGSLRNKPDEQFQCSLKLLLLSNRKLL